MNKASGREGWLVELFLPVNPQSAPTRPKEMLAEVKQELAGRLGGVTAHSRAPAQGLWQGEGDDIVILEVMCDAVDRDWWRRYKKQLAERLDQEEILVRVTRIETI